jgi:hypothetical protein
VKRIVAISIALLVLLSVPGMAGNAWSLSTPQVTLCGTDAADVAKALFDLIRLRHPDIKGWTEDGGIPMPVSDELLVIFYVFSAPSYCVQLEARIERDGTDVTQDPSMNGATQDFLEKIRVPILQTLP